MKLKKDSHRQAVPRLLTLAVFLTAAPVGAHPSGIAHVHAGAAAIPSFAIWAGLLLAGGLVAAILIAKKSPVPSPCAVSTASARRRKA